MNACFSFKKKSCRILLWIFSNGNILFSLKSISAVESLYLNEIQTTLVPFSEEKTGNILGF